MIFQNNHCTFLRKPHDLASTRGKQESFLDLAFEKESFELLTEARETIDPELRQLCVEHLGAHDTYASTIGLQEIIQQQKKLFSADQEYGLLNRLDNPTAGLLYFAKSKEVYEQRKDRQKNGKIDKYYLALVEHEPKKDILDLDLAHHSNGKKMIVIDEALLNSRRKQKIKGKALPARTQIIKSQPYQNRHLLTIHINKGRRHQIRAHLAQHGSPILGDPLYNEKATPDETLHLYSIGCTVC